MKHDKTYLSTCAVLVSLLKSEKLVFPSSLVSPLPRFHLHPHHLLQSSLPTSDMHPFLNCFLCLDSFSVAEVSTAQSLPCGSFIFQLCVLPRFQTLALDPSSLLFLTLHLCRSFFPQRVHQQTPRISRSMPCQLVSSILISIRVRLAFEN